MGAGFAVLFGETFGVFRAATVVFTAASALAVYGLCRQLGVDKGRSALGTAIYLFNPLGYVLSFTFMTDGYFAGLVAISAYCYAAGCRASSRRRGGCCSAPQQLPRRCSSGSRGSCSRSGCSPISSPAAG